MTQTFFMRGAVPADVITRHVGEELVLLHRSTNECLGLDPVGTRMWNLVTTSKSIQSAFEVLLSEYDVERGQLRNDLEEFIENLKRHKLIEFIPAASISSEETG